MKILKGLTILTMVVLFTSCEKEKETDFRNDVVGSYTSYTATGYDLSGNETDNFNGTALIEIKKSSTNDVGLDVYVNGQFDASYQKGVKGGEGIAFDLVNTADAEGVDGVELNGNYYSAAFLFANKSFHSYAKIYRDGEAIGYGKSIYFGKQ